MKKLSNLPLHIIATILYAAITISCMVNIIISFMPGRLINAVGYAAVTYGLFKNRRDWLVVSGFGLIVFTSLLSLIFSAVSLIQYYDHFNAFSMIFNLCSSAISLLCPLTAFILAFILLTDCVPKYRCTARNLWMVPPLCNIIINVAGIAFSLIFSYTSDSGVVWNIVPVVKAVIFTAVNIAALTAACKWMANE